jgi:hypothetical protein
MDIKRVATQPSASGPWDWFTGPVWIDPLFQAKILRWFKVQQLLELLRRK